jgi:hypothetical protein
MGRRQASSASSWKPGKETVNVVAPPGGGVKKTRREFSRDAVFEAAARPELGLDTGAAGVNTKPYG